MPDYGSLDHIIQIHKHKSVYLITIKSHQCHIKIASSTLRKHNYTIRLLW